MEYAIIARESLNELVDAVNEHMALGWKPQGGVFIAGKGFGQAIIREVDRTDGERV